MQFSHAGELKARWNQEPCSSVSNHSHEQVYCLLQPFVEGACFNLNVKGAMMSSLPEQTTLENVGGDATPIQPLPQATSRVRLFFLDHLRAALAILVVGTTVRT